MKLSDRQSTYHKSVEMSHRSPSVTDTVGHLGKASVIVDCNLKENFPS